MDNLFHTFLDPLFIYLITIIEIYVFPDYDTANGGRCDRSAVESHSSRAPDPTFIYFLRGPCLFCSCFVFFFWSLYFEYGSFSPPFTFPFYIYISWDIDLLNFMFGLYYESQNINLLLFHLHDVSCIDHVFLFFHLLKKIFTKIIVESL